LRRYIKNHCIRQVECAGARRLGVGARAQTFVVNARRDSLFSLGCFKRCNAIKIPVRLGYDTAILILQRGLVAAENLKRVANLAARSYCRYWHEIASLLLCKEPEELTRSHVRIIENQSRSNLIFKTNSSAERTT